jgi:rhodanese-related sulfurtransferase
MGQSCDLSFQQRSLFQQGYQSFTQGELKQLEWGLRFTPTACSSITAYALVTQNPYLLFIVGTLGIWAFFFPGKHPMDLIYNHLVRHIFTAIKLPENPFQRRLACLAAGVMNFTAGFLFLGGFAMAAWIVGGVLLVLQAIVITTHFCTLSWMYEGLMRLLGKWNQPVEISQAKGLLQNGAVLIDVRSPTEVAKGTLEGAINLPLEELEKHIDKFKENICLVFCSSGTRGHIAKQKLENMGIANIFNLGTLERARTAIL